MFVPFKIYFLYTTPEYPHVYTVQADGQNEARLLLMLSFSKTLCHFPHELIFHFVVHYNGDNADIDGCQKV